VSLTPSRCSCVWMGRFCNLCWWIYRPLLDLDHFRKVHMTTWPRTLHLLLVSSSSPHHFNCCAHPLPKFLLGIYNFYVLCMKMDFFSWLRRSLCEYPRLTWIWLICSSLLRGWVPLNMWKFSRTHRMCAFRLHLYKNPKIGAFRGDTGSGLL